MSKRKSAKIKALRAVLNELVHACCDKIDNYDVMSEACDKAIQLLPGYSDKPMFGYDGLLSDPKNIAEAQRREEEYRLRCEARKRAQDQEVVKAIQRHQEQEKARMEWAERFVNGFNQ